MSIKIHFIALIAEVCFVSTRAQFPFFGGCPNITVQQDFDVNKFIGKWYEIERTLSFLEFTAKCVSVTFNPTPYNDSAIEVLNEGKGPIIGLRKKVRLIANIPDKEEPAKMELKLNDLSLYGNYWILKTDYMNYAIVWSCNHIWPTFKKTRTENLWILSRNRNMMKDTRAMMKTYLEENQIKSRKLLRSVSQKGCD